MMNYYQRSAIYFLIASITFSGGLFVFYFLSHHETQPFNDTETINDEMPYAFESRPQKLPLTVLKNQSPPKEFTCTDKVVLAVLSDIKRNKEHQESLEFYIKENEVAGCAEIFDVKKEDLNRDGVVEFIVTTTATSLCSARSDCPSWIVSEKAGKMRIILRAGNFQEIWANESNYGGFKTIETYGTYGGCCYLNGEFRHENGRYRAFKCTEWSSTKTGFDKPRTLKPEKCGVR